MFLLSSCSDNEASTQTPPPPRKRQSQRFALAFFMQSTAAKGRLCPSPAIAGADERSRSRGADFCARGLHRHCEERSDEAIQNLAAALDCFATLAMTKQKRKRNADKRCFSTTAPSGAARTLADALACRRSTAALANGTRHPTAQLQARFPGTRSVRVLSAFACPSPGKHLPPRS
jgi:hypothetical protein